MKTKKEAISFIKECKKIQDYTWLDTYKLEKIRNEDIVWWLDKTTTEKRCIQRNWAVVVRLNKQYWAVWVI